MSLHLKVPGNQVIKSGGTGLTLSLISPSKSVKKCCPTPLIVGKQNGFILISRSGFFVDCLALHKSLSLYALYHSTFLLVLKKPKKIQGETLNGKTTFVFLSNFYSSFKKLI